MTEAAVDLAGLGALVEWTDAAAASDVRASVDPESGDGRLDELCEWLAATSARFPPLPPTHAVCVLVGSSTVPEPVSVIAERERTALVALDVAASGPADDDAVDRAFQRGAAAAEKTGDIDAAVEGGCDLLIVAGPDTTEVPALAVSVLTAAEPVALLPRGARAIDSAAWIRRAETLRDRRPEVSELRSRPTELLRALGSPTFAATAGLVMSAVTRRIPVVLDGTGAAAAALLCQDVQARAGRWWRFADRSPDPVHARVVAELSARPLLDLGTSAGYGVSGLLTLPLLRAAATR